MTADEKIAALRLMVYPDPSKCAEYVAARVLTGGRWHTGYLTCRGDYVSIRDSGRAARSQYATLNRNNIERVELRQPNGRYAPAFAADLPRAYHPGEQF